MATSPALPAYIALRLGAAPIKFAGDTVAIAGDEVVGMITEAPVPVGA